MYREFRGLRNIVFSSIFVGNRGRDGHGMDALAGPEEQ